MLANRLHKPQRTTRLLSALLLLFSGAASSRVCAELLPVKTYTTADGLLRDMATCIKQDSRGFLWFCTGDGISRFDGYGFTNYTTDDGLPHRLVNDFLETRSGVYWIATNDGLARFNPRGKRGLSSSSRNPQSPILNSDEPMFVVFRPEDKESAKGIDALFEDARGVLWCGTDDGLYWFEERDGKGIFHRVDFPKERPSVASGVSAIIQDKRGNLWIGMDYAQGLNRILPDGRKEHYSTGRAGGQEKNESIKTLLETKDGEIWAGLSLDGGLCSFVAEPPTRGAKASIFSRCYDKKDGLAANWIQSLYQASDDKLWVGTVNGITVFDPKAANASPSFTTYKEAQGLCDNGKAILEDRDGNIWIATSCGVKRVTHTAFMRYTQADGLASLSVNGIFTSHTGELFVITRRSVETSDKSLGAHQLNRFDRKKFIAVEPGLPQGVSAGWGGGQIVVQDTDGDWWLPGEHKAVYHFRKTDDLSRLAKMKPEAVELPEDMVFRLYEDSRGDVWISTMYGAHLLKWDRLTKGLGDYTQEFSAADKHTTSFADDNAGTLWLSFEYADSLVRYQNGRFTVLASNCEKTGGNITSLYFDHVGRLWLTTSLNGVGRIDSPNAEQLNIVWYNRRKGLATDGTRGLVEDNFGRIYVGHGRGVDRIDPATGQIKHYTSADGLPQGAVLFSARDSQGYLWFGGQQGLARLIPEQDKPRQSPNVLLTGLRVAGVTQSVSELGETNVPTLSLGSDQTQVSISFLGLGASLGEELKYQYKLEGAGGEWISTTQRTIDFANLAPGSYRFLVRAVTFDGSVSQTPASVAFTIAAPIWKRWWFVSLAALVIGGLAFAGYRYRVHRLLELERVRTRIATDLHDDIGSNLSKISILSEVARQQYEHDGNGETPLGSIANISRESVASMSDIVWAINPRKDSLTDLVRRMRRFAEDTLQSRNIVADFSAPEAKVELRLGSDVRRQIYLIFKECINNIVRHSHATRATIDLRIEAKDLVLAISDNGKGFDPGLADEGNGLASMQRRAVEVGGELRIDSAEGQGTRITLRAPLAAHEWFTLRS